ncbi:MAG: hypothetical protein ACMUIG_09835 [Thermoplasmatota archaeon]
MNLKVNFIEKEGYVLANIEGAFSRMGGLQLFRVLVEFSSNTEAENILLDCRGVGGDVKASDFFAFTIRTKDIMREYNLEGRIQEMKKAYVFDEDRYDMDQVWDTDIENENEVFIRGPGEFFL